MIYILALSIFKLPFAPWTAGLRASGRSPGPQEGAGQLVHPPAPVRGPLRGGGSAPRTCSLAGQELIRLLFQVFATGVWGSTPTVATTWHLPCHSTMGRLPGVLVTHAYVLPSSALADNSHWCSQTRPVSTCASFPPASAPGVGVSVSVGVRDGTRCCQTAFRGHCTCCPGVWQCTSVPTGSLCHQRSLESARLTLPIRSTWLSLEFP